MNARDKTKKRLQRSQKRGTKRAIYNFDKIALRKKPNDNALIAQWIERCGPNAEVPGSNPGEGAGWF